jgi:hypothetical protein
MWVWDEETIERLWDLDGKLTNVIPSQIVSIRRDKYLFDQNWIVVWDYFGSAYHQGRFPMPAHSHNVYYSSFLISVTDTLWWLPFDIGFSGCTTRASDPMTVCQWSSFKSSTSLPIPQQGKHPIPRTSRSNRRKFEPGLKINRQKESTSPKAVTSNRLNRSRNTKWAKSRIWKCRSYSNHLHFVKHS